MCINKFTFGFPRIIHINKKVLGKFPRKVLPKIPLFSTPAAVKEPLITCINVLFCVPEGADEGAGGLLREAHAALQGPLRRTDSRPVRLSRLHATALSELNPHLSLLSADCLLFSPPPSVGFFFYFSFPLCLQLFDSLIVNLLSFNAFCFLFSA